MKKRKIMMSAMSAALVGVVAIGGTLAYLSDKSNTVTNTFNVGSGYEKDDEGHTGLWLDEVDHDKVDEEGNPAERTETGNQYEDMMPGSKVEKDPTFHLTAGSTDSYVFAEVVGLDGMVDKNFLIGDEAYETVQPETSALSANWQKVDGFDNQLDGLYIYGTRNEKGEIVPTVVKGDTDLDPMFNYVWYDKDTVNAEHDKNVSAQASSPAAGILETITVRGAAVQTANLSWEQAQAEAAKVLRGEIEPLG